MRTKQVVVGDKSITLVELKYVDFVKLSKLRDNQEEYTKEIFRLSGIGQEIVDEFNVKDGINILKEISEFNGFTDFQ